MSRSAARTRRPSSSACGRWTGTGPGWTAQRAFNFIRGTEEWGCAYEIVIDGTPRGVTPPGQTSAGASAPLVITDIPLGQHRIEVRRKCYAELSLPMNVTQDIATDPLQLVPAVATVTLQSQAADAVVYIDGERRGVLRELSRLTVCEGRRVIEVRGADGRFVDRRDWVRGATETLSAELRAGFPIVASRGTAAMPADRCSSGNANVRTKHAIQSAATTANPTGKASDQSRRLDCRPRR